VLVVPESESAGALQQIEEKDLEVRRCNSFGGEELQNLAGRLKEVQELEENLLEVRKCTLGEEHPDTLITMQSLADTYTELGGRLKEVSQWSGSRCHTGSPRAPN
jgi:hypothetical protein